MAGRHTREDVSSRIPRSKRQRGSWDPNEIVKGTADAAFLSDDRGLIVAWNKAAEHLLGFAAAEVVGTPCHEILCGVDTFGNRFCDESCAIQKMATRDEPVQRFVMDVRHAGRRRLHLLVSVVRLPAAEGFLQLHLLHPAGATTSRAVGPSPDSEGPGVAERSEPTVEAILTLTPREREVLTLLAAGSTSQDVATELFISLTTVRTHVQNILRKLDVHSQLEAVATAYRFGLL